MVTIGGGIGAGKSVVSRVLRLMGYGVFDCDYEARLLMEKNAQMVSILKKLVGNEIYQATGILDRKGLAGKIFSNCELREKVNCIVHSAVRQRIDDWLKESPKNLFVETAIPVESGIAENSEAIWMVTAAEVTRKERVKQRDDRSEKDVENIIRIQNKEMESVMKLNCPVYVIYNNPEDSLLEQIQILLSTIDITTQN